jgi:hypothetical protein
MFIIQHVHKIEWYNDAILTEGKKEKRNLVKLEPDRTNASQIADTISLIGAVFSDDRKQSN